MTAIEAWSLVSMTEDGMRKDYSRPIIYSAAVHFRRLLLLKLLYQKLTLGLPLLNVIIVNLEITPDIFRGHHLKN